MFKQKNNKRTETKEKRRRSSKIELKYTEFCQRLRSIELG